MEGERREYVYFKDPYGFVMSGSDFHRDPDSLCEFQCFYKSRMEFCSRVL